MKTSVAPHVLQVLRGRAVPDASFLDYPPREWSWSIALALSSALLDNHTKDYWSSRSDMDILDIAHNTGQAWINRSAQQFKKYPEILPHASALLEELLLKSQDALLRLYGPNGPKVGHAAASGMHKAGHVLHPNTWMSSYFDMRQSIQNDDALNSRILDHLRRYPSGWTREKESYYHMSVQYDGSWPMFKACQTEPQTIEWFNASTLSTVELVATTTLLSKTGREIQTLNGVASSGVELGFEAKTMVSGETVNPINTFFKVGLELAQHQVGSKHPLHIKINVRELTDVVNDTSLQTLTAIQTAHSITQHINGWFESQVLAVRSTLVSFEPTFTVECEVLDSLANTIWTDTLNTHVQQYITDKFNIPECNLSA